MCEEEAVESLKVMAEKHAVIKATLQEAEDELNEKQQKLAADENKLRVKGGEVCIAEQQLRTLNEQIFYLREDFTEKENQHRMLLKELVDLEWNTGKITDEVAQLKKLNEEQTEIQNAHSSRVSAIEGTNDLELEALQNEIDQLTSLKTRLEGNDPTLKRIWTGQALQIIELEKEAVRNAFTERDIQSEMLQAELDDKLDQIKETEQKIHIEEKQNKARLRLMQKQLLELHETEKHLKSTVTYLEQQLEGKE